MSVTPCDLAITWQLLSSVLWDGNPPPNLLPTCNIPADGLLQTNPVWVCYARDLEVAKTLDVKR